nr:myosin heavy chain-related protein [Tanacetum cinerariifolium]
MLPRSISKQQQQQGHHRTTMDHNYDSKGSVDVPIALVKPITHLVDWKDYFFYVKNKNIPSDYPELLLESNKFDKKSFGDKVPLHPELDPLYDQIASYPCHVRTFLDPILYLAGLKTSWKHSLKEPVIYYWGLEMDFRSFMMQEIDAPVIDANPLTSVHPFDFVEDAADSNDAFAGNNENPLVGTSLPHMPEAGKKLRLFGKRKPPYGVGDSLLKTKGVIEPKGFGKRPVEFRMCKSILRKYVTICEGRWYVPSLWEVGEASPYRGVSRQSLWREAYGLSIGKTRRLLVGEGDSVLRYSGVPDLRKRKSGKTAKLAHSCFSLCGLLKVGEGDAARSGGVTALAGPDLGLIVAVPRMAPLIVQIWARSGFDGIKKFFLWMLHPNRDGERGFDYMTPALVLSKAHREGCRASRGGFPYCDPDAKYALSKLLQIGTMAKYQNGFEMLINRVTEIPQSLLVPFYISGLKLDLQRELNLVSMPTTLGNMFSLAHIIEAHFEDTNNQAVDNNGGDKINPNMNDKQEVKKDDDQEIKNVKDEERKNVKDQQVFKQTINETADTITSLQSEVASLDAKGSLDANEEIKKDHTWIHELEKQVEKLPIELQFKNKCKEALETTSKDLEKKMLDLNPMLHDPQKVVVVQKKETL